MNVYEIALIGVFVVLTLILSSSVCFLYAISSLIAFIFSFIISSFGLTSIIILLTKIGWRENLYTPSMVYVLTVVIVWGLLYTIFTSFLPSAKKCLADKVLAIPIALIFTLGFSVIACLSLPPFLSSETSTKNLANCRICRIVKSSNIDRKMKLRSLQQISIESLVTNDKEQAYILPNYLKSSENDKDLENNLLTLINNHRQSKGLNPMMLDKKISLLANFYSQEILSNKYFSHIDLLKRSPEDRAKEMEVDFEYFGENLAIASTLSEAHRILLESPSHLKNIESTLFRRVGLSVYKLKPDSVIVVEEFAN